MSQTRRRLALSDEEVLGYLPLVVDLQRYGLEALSELARGLLERQVEELLAGPACRTSLVEAGAQVQSLGTVHHHWIVRRAHADHAAALVHQVQGPDVVVARSAGLVGLGDRGEAPVVAAVRAMLQEASLNV